MSRSNTRNSFGRNAMRLGNLIYYTIRTKKIFLFIYIRREFERKIADLQREEESLKQEAKYAEFDEEEELQELKRKFVNEQEEKFAHEREA